MIGKPDSASSASSSRTDGGSATEPLPRAAWSQAHIPVAAFELEGAGWSRPIATLLARRGVTSAAEARRFLEPQIEHLRDPHVLPGLPAAVSRLVAAMEKGEKVAIVGDYDADGVTATALLASVLGLCGVGTECILPDRFLDGYGFQTLHAERAQQAGCRLLITVDCGIGSHDAVAWAMSRGLSVIVTDHHLPESRLPPAEVIVNPHLGGPEALGRELTGVGLALKLGMALLRALGREVPLRSLLRVACIGTIADVAPLLDENRVIAALGLASLAPLSEVRSPGLRALIRRAQVDPPVTALDVAYRLAPRINAAGRLASAEIALELLRTRDEERAGELSRQLDELNRERQSLERIVVDDARARFEERWPLPSILVASGSTWHRGVVGIAAGRLARQFHRPVVLLAEVDGALVGSGRSVPGIDLHQFLAPWTARMLRFGGHAQAIGLSLSVAELEGLRTEWESSAAEWPSELLQPRFEFEVEVGAADLTRELLTDLSRLAPHGAGNPEPVLRVAPTRATRAPRVFGNRHLEVGIRSAAGGQELRLVGWGWAEQRDLFSGMFEALVVLDTNARQPYGPAARIVDARPCKNPATS